MMIRHILAQLVVACCLFAIATSAPAQGKKGGGSSPPPLPNIAYEVTFLPIDRYTEVHDANNNLQVVGSHYSVPADGSPSTDYVGFLYDHSSGAVLTLEDLISQVDLQALQLVGLTQSKFRGINDSGVIVGYVGNADWSVADGIIVDSMSGAITRSSNLVAFDNSYLLHINNSGDLVGGYHVDGDHRYTFVASYDAANAVYVIRDFGPAFRQTFNRSGITDTRLVMLSGDTWLQTWEFDINSGMLVQASEDADGVRLNCRDSFGRYAGSRKVKSKIFPIAFDQLQGTVIWQSTRTGSAEDINDPSLDDLENGVGLGDVLFVEAKVGRDPLYLRNSVWGELNMDVLLDPLGADNKEWLQTSAGYSDLHMTEKLAGTNFGAIAGKLATGNRAFLLVPKPFAR